ncbi:binding-protein-dependent transport system inner membrane protein [Roseivivax marinus]|uniref:Binding-protein-dependent transport system inner membrane protein n=1 Tax=Roseivivax marinus TaxID=1379903 RepID=W4HFF9_9RHOB|nr:ABC transporter permease [Roseivivax marinus]ETW11429.1 binding-protein-dependent transport system inner membrane protein [Roseivivax marinus]
MSGVATAPATARLRRLVRSPRAVFGGVLVALAILAAIFAPVLTPYGPNETDFVAVLQAPSGVHPLGTDDLGRDILTRVLFGARVSLIVGVVSVLASLVVGGLIGAVAGYAAGWTDTIIMRLMDVIFAFPSVLLALAITAVLGPSLGNAILAIAVVNLPVFARIARAQTMVVRSLDFVEAKRALGFGPVNILLRSILPNIAAPMLVQGSLLFAAAIITESYLSFLGLGAQPPTATWGNMLRDAIGFLELAPWMAWFSGLAIFLTVLGFNVVGDAMRDHFDPRTT